MSYSFDIYTINSIPQSSLNLTTQLNVWLSLTKAIEHRQDK